MIQYYGTTKPNNPQIGDVYIDASCQRYLAWNGHTWAEFQTQLETEDQRVRRELKELQDFMQYKGITDDELKDFIDSRKLVERMQQE